jgi:hypothetical protein
VFFTGSNKIVKHVLLTNFLIDENQKHEKRNKNKRGITKPDLIQKQRLLKEYQKTKYLTQERNKELEQRIKPVASYRQSKFSTLRYLNAFKSRRVTDEK